MARPRKPDAKVAVPLRLRPLLLQQVDDWAASRGVSRQEAIEQGLEALVRLGGFDQEPGAAPRPKPAKPFVSRLKGQWKAP